MKRLCVAIAVMGLFIVGDRTLLAQQFSRPIDDNDSKELEKHFKMREEMHRRMMEKLLHGFGPDQDMFSDMEKFLDKAIKDPLRLHSSAKNYSTQWQEDQEGRTLAVIPSTPEQKLDISVSGEMITIKGVSEVKGPGGVSVSNFSNSFNVPSDCDGSRVRIEQDGGKILVKFPLKKLQKPQTKPVAPNETDVHI